MNYLDMYEQNYTPLISMDEMKKNTIEVDSNTTELFYAQPYKLGCPFVMSVECDHSRLGYNGSTFHIIISENLYTYYDVLVTDRRNGKGLMVCSPKDFGSDAEIIPMKGGFRMLMKMASGHEEDWISPSELTTETELERVDNAGEDEFTSNSTSYSGNLMASGSSDRYGFDFYRHVLGASELSLSYLITAEASFKDLKINPISPQLNNLPAEASQDIINFFTEKQYGVSSTGKSGITGVYTWLPKFILNLGKELKSIVDNKMMYSTGWSRSNGRETLYGGAGYYHQIKNKGSHFYYQTADQAWDLILSMMSSMYADKPHISREEREIEVELGSGIYELIQPKFSQYFEAHNKFLITGEHPALVNQLYTDKNGDLAYKPKKFGSVYYENFGWVRIKKNEMLDRLDNHKKYNKFHLGKPLSSFMIFVKDVTDKSFTKANFEGIKAPAGSGNVLYIKRKGMTDSMEFTIGGGNIAPQLLSAIGANPKGNHSRDQSFKGVKLTFRSAPAEVFVQDASRTIIAELDPTGDLEAL
ncbi:MAG: hypothetical protein ACRC5G_01005, partial [Cetobacterium sp.]